MIPEDVVTHSEFEQFAKRIEAEDSRINARLKGLDDTVKQINGLVVSVEKLANNMEQMAKTQNEQNKKLEKLENRDGEKWRSVTGYVTTTIIGILLGFVLKQMGL